jgi:hypothetical protein
VIEPLEFALRAIAFGAEIAAVLLAARALSRRFYPEGGAVAFGILASALVCFPALALGALGILRLHWLLLLHGMLAALVLWLGRGAPDPPPRSPAEPDDPFPAVAGATAVVVALYFAERGLFLPPLSWDSLRYHLPMAVEWIQSGRLDPLYHAVTPYASYYPGTGDLLTLFALLPWENDLVAGITALPMLALAGFAVDRIAREAGAPPRLARYAPILFLATPCVARFAATQYVEPALNAWLLSAVAMLLVYRRSGRPGDLLLAALSTALAVGTKHTAWLLAFPLVAAGAWLALHRRPRPIIALAAAAAFLALGSYWHLRNWILAGSPFYPAEVKILGATLFEGIPQTLGSKVLDSGVSLLSTLPDIIADGTLLRAVLGTSAEHEYEMGIGPKAFPLALLTLVALALLFEARGRRLRERAAAAIALALGIWFLLVFAATPYYWHRYLAYYQRFAAPALALAAVAAVLVATWRGAREWALAALTVACVAPDLVVLAMAPRLSTRSALLVLGIGATAWAWGQLRWRPGPVARATACVLAIPLLYGVHAYREDTRHHAYEREIDVAWTASHRYSSAWAWLDAATRGWPRPPRIAWSGQNLIYPLYGPRLDRVVRYVDVNRAARGAFHRYPLGAFRSDPDPDAWIENLRRAEIDLVVLTQPDWEDPWPVEAAWAAQRPERFALVFESPRARIYRVLR